MTNIDKQMMFKILKMTQREVKQYAKKVLKKHGYKPVLNDGYIYAKGEIPVGLLAHMDTVFREPDYVFDVDGVLSGQKGLGADDRAGIYAILHLVKQGYKPTVIFLEDEEIGGVGAEKFATDSYIFDLELNFLIELDRQGLDDAVFYDCGNKDFHDHILGFGFKKAYGSFSDISFIAPKLDLGAVNLSVGYFGQHTINEFLILDGLARTIDRVEQILLHGSNVKFDFQEDDWKSYYKAYATGQYTVSTTKKYATRTTSQKDYAYGYAEGFYDEYEELEYFYDRVEETKYDEETPPWYDDEEVQIWKMLPLQDCIVNLPNKQIVDCNYCLDYYMNDRNEVYHIDKGLIRGAIVMDYDWAEMTYDKMNEKMNWNSYLSRVQKDLKGGWNYED